MATRTRSLPPRLTRPVDEDDHIRGQEDAPVTLVEYGDYECPHCRMVYHNIQALQEQLGDRLRYIYRHLPLTSVHPHAELAAEAAEAAAAQGKFWEMHEALYERGRLDKEHILQYTAEIGLDVERFQRDLEGHVYAGRVREDFESGIRSGANGTPTFFVNGERYDGAWDLESLLERVERPLGARVQRLGQQFAQIAALGGVLLLITTIVALVWANSPWGTTYFELRETTLTFSLGERSLSESLLHWINDGLMVIFFFVVGLEIKREILVGELAEPRRAALPVAGALGGMLAPAIFYLLFNAGDPAARGWGIPMATDIAFTLGILAVLGSRVPPSLKVFFTALAIADDLGAILVIALFYSSGISWAALGAAALLMLALIVLNRGRVYSSLPYALLGIGLWLAFLRSGIHTTIAGVLLAMTIPSRSPANIRGLLAQAVTVLGSAVLQAERKMEVDADRQATVQALETIVDRVQSPAQNLEHNLNPWSSYVILPIFALANAGVVLSADVARGLLSPVSVGIILGLVAGKPLGITLLSWVAVRTNVAEKPGGVSWSQFFSTSCLAGIGFTMSLFIADAAFADPGLLDAARLAIMVASLLAVLVGTTLLFLTSPPQAGSTEIES